MKGSIWTYSTRTDRVVRCSYKCEREHEHFVGTYEKAMIYFKGEPDTERGHKNLKDIVIYHQLSPDTLTKSSAELYDILIDACAKKEYWVPVQDRHSVVMEVLAEAEKEYMIKDDEIFKKAKQEGSNKRMMKRLYKQERWESMIKYK